jgi:prepilin-type N-terminal cleavage/methylation domain-containing protein
MKWAKTQSGFTIVELLIVVVVIAVLSTIVVIGYRGVTDNAKSVVLDVSLKNAADQMKLASLDTGGTPPTDLPSTVKPEKDTVLHLASAVASGTTKEFCINGYRISSYAVSSYNSKDGSIKPYLCPGILMGSPDGGSLPAIPLNTNLVADFSQWTISGAVTYNATANQLEFTGVGGYAVSPLVRLAGVATNAAFTAEFYSTSAAPDHTPQSGTYTGSAYFGSDGTTPVMNSISYATNGNSQAFPVSAWAARTFVIQAGPNVQYIRFNINVAPTTYTGASFNVRNPSIERR